MLFKVLGVGPTVKQLSPRDLTLSTHQPQTGARRDQSVPKVARSPSTEPARTWCPDLMRAGRAVNRDTLGCEVSGVTGGEGGFAVRCR
ncbi:hypothetical protein EV643_12229 [Kribbella sp. VKM Ac-2527]|uniref:Uncharacterized protein n=1 Tax=Kribbella caucasensis TaxID=2512215 RepID=A0A4V3C6Y7_9ACTN|nr:hypothetical protein [Kribbella sp. VKM Ac-2527]TDO35618.1 hypothetical protein EV643_12229 [Kribbella sp. VKM Ac-2527]